MFTALGWLGLACASRAPQPLPDIGAGVSLLDGQGREQTVALGPGQSALVLHFWATWCAPCVQELAVLERAAASCPAGRVRVIAVNVAEPPQKVARFVREHDVGLEILRDASGELWRSGGFGELPADWFWTAAERSTVRGPLSEAQWAARLRELGC
jgi:thiol-disulfide isomerase/thioredoxin